VNKTQVQYNGSVQPVLKWQHPNLPAIIINANQTTKKRENLTLLLIKSLL